MSDQENLTIPQGDDAPESFREDDSEIDLTERVAREKPDDEPVDQPVASMSLIRRDQKSSLLIQQCI